MPVILQIWDSLFVHKSQIMDFAYYVGLAQMMEIEHDIMAATTMTAKLEILQHFDIDGITRMLKNADMLWEKDHKESKSWWKKHKEKKKSKQEKKEKEKREKKLRQLSGEML